MFEAIMVRRNSSSGLDALDLGHLAEMMLFYRTVRLCLTRGSLRQLIDKCGPELALEIVESSNLHAVYLDTDVGVYTVNTGSKQERHTPSSFKILDGPSEKRAYEDTVIHLFREATGKSGKGRRLASRFMKHTRLHEASPDDFSAAARADWENEPFIQQAIHVFLNEFAPSYPNIADIQITLRQEEDGYFAVDTNLDLQRLQAAYVPRGDMKQLKIGDLLAGMVAVREDLYLSATFGSAIAQNSYAARLTRAMCADLTAAVDKQRTTIDQFQHLVVRGINDLATAINSGQCSFGEFLKLLKKAENFRDWLETQSPDEDLVRSYFREASKGSWLEKQPAKTLRWMVPTASGFALFLPDAALAAPAAAGALTVIDQFLISRLAQGWRPSSFIDNELRPLLNR